MLKRVGLGFLSKLYAAASMFLVSVLFARILGPTDFGYFSFLITLAPLFSYLFVYGQDQSILKSVSGRTAEYLRYKLYPRMCLALFYNFLLFVFVLFFFLAVSVFIVDKVQDVTIKCVLYSLFIGYVFSVRRVFFIFFRLNQKEFCAILPESIIYPSLMLALSVIFILFEYTPSFIFLVNMLFLLSIISLYPYFPQLVITIKSFIYSRKIFMFWFRQGRIFCALALAEASIFFVDRILVFNFYGPETLAFYQVAIRFVEITLIFESAYLLISMPVISSQFSKGCKLELNSLCLKQTRFIFIFNLAVATFLYNFSYLLRYIYGEEFASAIPLLNIFCFFLVLNSFVGASNYICTVVGLEYKALFATIACVFVFLFVTITLHKSLDLESFIILKCSLDFLRKLYCSYILKNTGLNLFLR